MHGRVSIIHDDAWAGMEKRKQEKGKRERYLVHRKTVLKMGFGGMGHGLPVASWCG